MNVIPRTSEYSIEEVKKMTNEMLKFVRVAGEYRFCCYDSQHSSLATKKEALSAGLISIYKDTFKFMDTYSMTLKIGVDEYDHERLEMLLGKKFKHKYDD